MYHLHLTRNLRSLAFLLIAAAVLAILATLAWANHTGLPASWRAPIERAISKQGAYVKIGRLSYLPLRGVIASNVRVFSDPALLHESARLESVILGFDKTKLARGIVNLTKIEFKDASLALPLDPHDPASSALEITGANGTLLMPGERRFEVRNANGRVAGIDIQLDAELIGYHQQGNKQPKPQAMEQRRELYARIFDELKQWHFNQQHPPQLRISIQGNVNQLASITAKLTLHAKDVEKNQHVLDEVTAEAEITGDLLTVTALHASDAQGSLDGHADYDLRNRDGRFDLRSSLEIPRLLQAWLGLPPMRDVIISGSQSLEAAGQFRLEPNQIPKIQMTGHASCRSVMAKSLTMDSVSTAFSWRDGDLFLRDLCITRPDGEVRGKALIQGPLVRLALTTTLPIAVCRPLFIGHPVEPVLNDFTERKGSEVFVSLEGGFNTNDPLAWGFVGTSKVKNINYRGVPVNSAECRLSLNHYELDFIDGTVVFNYQNYALRDAFNGPKQGSVKVGRVRYDASAKLVEIEDLAGSIWAPPAVRLFAPALADSLEVYRFHRPPELHSSGIIDTDHRGRTALNVNFSSESPADYRFLGTSLTLEKPSGKVVIRGDRVTVEDLKLNAFDGPVTGRFLSNGKGALEGEMTWTQLTIPSLTSAYGFQWKSGGTITGRIDFSMNDGQVETMEANGLFALEDTELFSVPIFGPMSPLVGSVLNDRRAGFERAKDAFCTFNIHQGILTTKDFRTTTKSLVFTADGAVDLKTQSLDLTMRMNARGWLGLITLPLRPFYGLFQFRGTGPLKKPQWENVMFTTPPTEQNELLLPAPKAKIIESTRP